MAMLAKKVIKRTAIPHGISVETTDKLLYLLENFPESSTLREGTEQFGPGCVLISGDRSALLLREKLKIPVIPVKVTGFDLMKALIEARQYSPEVAVVNYFRKMPDIDVCRDILKVKVSQYSYLDLKEAHQLFKRLKTRGCKVVVGASLACDLAEEYGMKAIFFYSPSALQEALRYALDMIASYQEETERANTFKAIVDFTHSGIIGTDRHFRVSTFNPAAEKILGLKSSDVIGQDFSSLFPEFQVDKKGGSLAPKINSLGGFGAARVVFSSLPILVGGEAFGQVTVFQDTATIQMAEEKIRWEAHHKRFLAQHTLGDIVGKSPVVRKTVEKAKRYGRSGSAVLIAGETGTGKELFAQGIHNCSPRQGKPFVAVNCAALPESLLDSELFGYEQGAFTGARKGGKPGLFEMAHTGTIFLDEVGEISPAVQARLLRVLQEKVVMRLGGDRLIPVDVRVISATNRDLWEMVRAGKFREDLYYRISVLELQIPPLRHRTDDLPRLIRSLLQHIAPQILISGGDLVVEAFSGLKGYNWPGNVRELENILERFVSLAEDAEPELETYRRILSECHRAGSRVQKADRRESPGLDLKLRETQESEINRVLEEMLNNKTHAARALGMSRSTLYRKLRKLKEN